MRVSRMWPTDGCRTQVTVVQPCTVQACCMWPGCHWPIRPAEYPGSQAILRVTIARCELSGLRVACSLAIVTAAQCVRLTARRCTGVGPSISSSVHAAQPACVGCGGLQQSEKMFAVCMTYRCEDQHAWQAPVNSDSTRHLWLGSRHSVWWLSSEQPGEA